MAHTTLKTNIGNNALAVITFTAYTQGGESFTEAEFGLTTAPRDVVLLQDPRNPIQAIYMGGGVVELCSDQGCAVEIPSGSINFVLAALVIGT